MQTTAKELTATQASALARHAAPALFNGKYTIDSPKGGHRTLRVSTQKANAKFAAGRRIIALLEGSDNCTDYKGFAFLDDTYVSIWRKKCGTVGKPSAFEIYAAMLTDMNTKGEASRYHGMGYRLLLEKTCIRCNRVLTHPESIRAGIGPVCATKGM